VHAHDEHFLVVRSIEDADAAPLWQADGRPPEIIVIILLIARALERTDATALWIDA